MLRNKDWRWGKKQKMSKEKLWKSFRKLENCWSGHFKGSREGWLLVFWCPRGNSIHFLYPLNPSVGSRGGCSLSQWSLGERRGSPWTDHQSITGSHRDEQPHTLLRTVLETPINLTACVWTVGGSRRTRREPGENPRIHGENMQPPHRQNQPGLEPGTSAVRRRCRPPPHPAAPRGNYEH